MTWIEYHGGRPWDLGVINRIPSVLWDDGARPLWEFSQASLSHVNQGLMKQLQRDGAISTWFISSARYHSWFIESIMGFRRLTHWCFVLVRDAWSFYKDTELSIYVTNAWRATYSLVAGGSHAIALWMCRLLGESLSCSIVGVDSFITHTYWLSVQLVHTYTGW